VRFGANANLLPVSHILDNKVWTPPGCKCTLGEHKMDSTVFAL
jgi:hypothetical protein